jgi:hypothetical protein
MYLDINVTRIDVFDLPALWSNPAVNAAMDSNKLTNKMQQFYKFIT